MTSDDRKYSEEEVRQILEKAVEGTPSQALRGAEGLSLVDLKSIGAEVGIDPGRIEDAARSLSLRGPNKGNPLLGAPTVLQYEAKVEGDLVEADTPEVLSAIRRIMGHQGTVSDVHGSLEWSVSTDAGSRYITLSTRDGITTIRGSANLSQGALLSYLPLGIASLCGLVPSLIALIKGGNPLALLVFLGLAPILYAGLRVIWKRTSAKEADQLQRAVAELARLAEASGNPDL